MKTLRHEFVATGYIITPDKKKMLLILHKKYHKWIPPGGHVDKNELPHESVLREIREETGITASFLPNTFTTGLQGKETELPTPFYMLRQEIPAYKRKRKHIHIDMIYLLEAKEQEITKEKDIPDARWVTKQEIMEMDTFAFVKLFAEKVLQ